MPRFIAFPRAINVGSHTVKMAHLRTLFEAMDFSEVETLIASGNVIFYSSAENVKALKQTIGVEPRYVRFFIISPETHTK